MVNDTILFDKFHVQGKIILFCYKKYTVRMSSNLFNLNL